MKSKLRLLQKESPVFRNIYIEVKRGNEFVSVHIMDLYDDEFDAFMKLMVELNATYYGG